MRMSCQAPGCGKLFDTARSSAKFCSAACRQRAHRARGSAGGSAPAAGVVAAPRTAPGLVEATRVELEAAERLGTVLGRQAVALAEAIEHPSTTGAAVASLSRELRTVMAEAMRGAATADDRLDEVARRRALKAASA